MSISTSTGNHRTLSHTKTEQRKALHNTMQVVQIQKHVRLFTSSGSHISADTEKTFYKPSTNHRGKQATYNPPQWTFTLLHIVFTRQSPNSCAIATVRVKGVVEAEHNGHCHNVSGRVLLCVYPEFSPTLNPLVANFIT